MPQPQTKLAQTFRRERVLTLPQLMERLGCSRMTVIRRLQEVGYLSSCSHAGRYYTLPELARFNGRGLWHYQDILFSRFGTLKRTVVELVEQSEAGYCQRELTGVVRVRCHNVLLELTRGERLHREKIQRPGPSFYFSAVPAIQANQVAERRRWLGVSPTGAAPASELPAPPVESEVVIAVLVTLVKDPGATPAVIARRLREQGLRTTPAQVRHVFDTYDLLKKRAVSTC